MYKSSASNPPKLLRDIEAIDQEICSLEATLLNLSPPGSFLEAQRQKAVHGMPADEKSIARSKAYLVSKLASSVKSKSEQTSLFASAYSKWAEAACKNPEGSTISALSTDEKRPIGEASQQRRHVMPSNSHYAPIPRSRSSLLSWLSEESSKFITKPLPLKATFPLNVHARTPRFRAWTPHEKRVFMHQYTSHPKKFHKISPHLALRSTRECVLFYYLHKKQLGLKERTSMKGIYIPREPPSGER